MRNATLAATGFTVLALLLSTPLVTRLAAEEQEAQATPPSPPMRVMTFNIRYDNPRDGDDGWANRRSRVASEIRMHRPDLVGLQEALGHQLSQLTEDLDGVYGSFGVGRDDGERGGEFSAILYRLDRFSVTESDTFWLSEEPRTPGSKGWDAACTRVVTWGELLDRRSRRRLLYANTHWDHVGEAARTNSATLTRGFMARRGTDLPRILTGDFNCTLDSAPMLALVDGGALVDAQTLSPHPAHGPSGTFIGFEEPKVATRKIDHILVGGGVRVLQQGVLADHWDGSYPSDHLPVVADIVLP